MADTSLEPAAWEEKEDSEYGGGSASLVTDEHSANEELLVADFDEDQSVYSMEGYDPDFLGPQAPGVEFTSFPKFVAKKPPAKSLPYELTLNKKEYFAYHEAAPHDMWFCEYPQCEVTFIPYLLWGTRHHCRACGLSVCGEHSTPNVTLSSHILPICRGDLAEITLPVLATSTEESKLPEAVTLKYACLTCCSNAPLPKPGSRHRTKKAASKQANAEPDEEDSDGGEATVQVDQLLFQLHRTENLLKERTEVVSNLSGKVSEFADEAAMLRETVKLLQAQLAIAESGAHRKARGLQRLNKLKDRVRKLSATSKAPVSNNNNHDFDSDVSSLENEDESAKADTSSESEQSVGARSFTAASPGARAGASKEQVYSRYANIVNKACGDGVAPSSIAVPPARAASAAGGRGPSVASHVGANVSAGGRRAAQAPVEFTSFPAHRNAEGEDVEYAEHERDSGSFSGLPVLPVRREDHGLVSFDSLLRPPSAAPADSSAAAIAVQEADTTEPAAGGDGPAMEAPAEDSAPAEESSHSHNDNTNIGNDSGEDSFTGLPIDEDDVATASITVVSVTTTAVVDSAGDAAATAEDLEGVEGGDADATGVPADDSDSGMLIVDHTVLVEVTSPLATIPEEPTDLTTTDTPTATMSSPPPARQNAEAFQSPLEWSHASPGGSIDTFQSAHSVPPSANSVNRCSSATVTYEDIYQTRSTDDYDSQQLSVALNGAVDSEDQRAVDNVREESLTIQEEAPQEASSDKCSPHLLDIYNRQTSTFVMQEGDSSDHLDAQENQETFGSQDRIQERPHERSQHRGSETHTVGFAPQQPPSPSPSSQSHNSSSGSMFGFGAPAQGFGSNPLAKKPQKRKSV